MEVDEHNNANARLQNNGENDNCNGLQNSFQTVAAIFNNLPLQDLEALTINVVANIANLVRLDGNLSQLLGGHIGQSVGIGVALQVFDIFVLLSSLFNPQFFEEVDAEAALLEDEELHENRSEVVLMVGVHSHEVDNGGAVDNDGTQEQIPGVGVELIFHVDIPDLLGLLT